MTRLSRTLWTMVAVAATSGLLLSLVVMLRPAAGELPPDVRGRASVESAPHEGRERRVASATVLVEKQQRPARVRRSSAALSDRPVERRMPPARVRIASLGLDLDVRATGLAEGRQMRLPADPRVLGWYRYGPAPGGRGSAVLAGHVDTREFGLGPLAALASVRRGALVEVALRDGGRRTFRVDSIERVDSGRLPDEVFSREGRPRLRLVTCAGAFLPEAGGYQENLVVTALPVRG